MITLLKCEFKKTRRRYIFLTALAITALGVAWALYGDYSDKSSFAMQNGWMMLLYQLPLVSSIIFPLMSTVVASRLADIEHKGCALRQLCTLTGKGQLYDAKLLYGLGMVCFSVLLSWTATIVFGHVIGFGDTFPVRLYLLYLLFTLVPTIAVYIFQHTLSILFKNQAVSFFVGILGEFAGLFSMFLPQAPWFRRSIIWGYYGVLQFVGLFGWTKEARYADAYFEVMKIDWTFFCVLVAATMLIYLIGRKIFCDKEV